MTFHRSRTGKVHSVSPKGAIIPDAPRAPSASSF